jgi:hypothetical protein
MRFIPTRVHGILDYASGSVQIFVPWLLGAGATRLEQSLPPALGAGILGYSALTAYELGVFRVIPMPVHLGLDVLSAGLLLAAPWLFGFSGKAKAAYTAIGLFECAVILTSQTAPPHAAPMEDTWQVAR